MRMGVAMVTSVFYPSVGGIQTHTLRLCHKLRQRGVDVVVLTRHRPGLARFERLDGLPVHRLGTSRAGRAIEALTYIAQACGHLVRERRRFQVVHAHQMLSPMSIGLFSRRALGQQLVVNPHLGGAGGDVDLLRHERPWTGRARLGAAKAWANAYVCISREIREELCDLGIPEARIWEIANGVDTERFCPLPAEARRRMREGLGLPAGQLFVFTGRLVAQKGLDVLLRAWPSVRARMPQAQLLVVGEGEARPSLEALAQELGIVSSIHWRGACDDVASFLQAADVYVLPSRAEGLPVALLEAMACALPVVATRVGGTVELLDGGRAGVTVPPEDSVALADALIRAVGPDSSSWGLMARRRVVEHHALDRVVDRYLELYDSLQ